jgi:hypothetical protein
MIFMTKSKNQKIATKKWCLKNPEKWATIQARSHKKHPESNRKATKKWRATHRAEYNAYQANYQRELKKRVK